MKYYLLSILCASLLASCESLIPPAPADEDVLDGPLEGLTHSQAAMHVAGDVAFNDQNFTSINGLGPCFVATSCGGCHAGDGKGHPFTTLTRFGQIDSTGNKFLEYGGPQLQHRALIGYSAESIPAGATFSSFTPPATTGLGFFELVSDEDLLALSDPNDANGDGISGRPNWNKLPAFVYASHSAIANGDKYICRFGKKASTYNLFQQTVTAYNQDMGITSTYLPNNPVNYLDGVHPIPSGTPEVTEEIVNAVVVYLQTLKAPIARNHADPAIERGKNIFIQIGCENCHIQTLKTGFSQIEALSNKEFHPFTDLLLHDMGPGLDDGYTEGTALTSEWRTAPLWGLGLSPNSQGGSYFLLHDGRAHSIEDAILLHGGEALKSRDSYQSLSVQDKELLKQFLESL